MTIVNWFIRLIVWGAMLGCWGASMLANYNQANIVGASKPQWAWAFVVAFLGFDIAKVAAPLAMRSCWRQAQYPALAVGIPIWILVVATSFTCATTFYGARVADLAQSRSNSSFLTGSTKRDILRLERSIEGYEERKIKTPTKEWAGIDAILVSDKAELAKLKTRLATEPAVGAQNEGDEQDQARLLTNLLVAGLEVIGAFGLMFFAPLLGVDLEAKVAAALQAKKTPTSSEDPESNPPKPRKRQVEGQNAGNLARGEAPKGAKGSKIRLATLNGSAVSGDPKLVWRDRAQVLVDELRVRFSEQELARPLVFDVFHELATAHGWDLPGKKRGHDLIGTGLRQVGVDKTRRRTKGVGPETYYVLPNRNETKTPSDLAG